MRDWIIGDPVADRLTRKFLGAFYQKCGTTIQIVTTDTVFRINLPETVEPNGLLYRDEESVIGPDDVAP